MMRSLSAADWNNPNVRFGSLSRLAMRPVFPQQQTSLGSVGTSV
jgi:hypothetical protein